MTTKTIAGWTIEYDKAATQAAYSALPDGMDCSCCSCRNYEKMIPDFPKEVHDFFNELGIDITKPPEIYDFGYFEDDKLPYGGWYHIVGNYFSGDDAWQPVAKDPAHQTVTELHKIANNFEIGFTHMVSIVPEGFPTPILQMEITFSLPWILDEPYPMTVKTKKSLFKRKKGGKNDKPNPTRRLSPLQRQSLRSHRFR